MMVRYSRAAKRQMVEIWRYSAPRWGDARADAYVRAIDAAIRAVAAGASKARRYEGGAEGLSRIKSGSHDAYLALDPEADVLHVVTVLHQRMDPSRHLKGE